MKKVIGISILPQEIDFLQNILTQLKISSTKLSPEDKFLVDIKLLTSSKLTDWNTSVIPKEFFIQKLNSLKLLLDWCEFDVETDENILGCVSYRIYLQEKYLNEKSITWLDADMIFDENTLPILSQCIEAMPTDYWILTPEVVKLWDDTWDCLVNKDYLSCPFDYQKTSDCFTDTRFNSNDINLIPVHNEGSLSRLKFAGGWLTTFSPKIFELCPIPKSLGHYGLEDTFLMVALNSNYNVTQYKIENLVVAENYKYKDFSYTENFISPINRKDEFRQIAHQNFTKEIKKL